MSEINITKSFQLVYPRKQSSMYGDFLKVHDMMTSGKNVLQYKFSYSVLLISAGNANELKRNIFLNNFFR